jgi:pimeloyl-ACP methyl ester carboxylesterase
MVHYRNADTGGHRVSYREAGEPANPTVLLLHGFPTSSHMFRDLMPLLADRYHVVAPDLPGFGNTVSPPRGQFDYTFDNLARVIGEFVEKIGLSRYALYVFDYGAPVGYRLAVAHPARVAAIVGQNGNAYEEGLSEGWTPIRAYWEDPSPSNREALRSFLAPETTMWQYLHGVPDVTRVAPGGYSLDNYYLARSGIADIQLDLFGDYKNNVSLYPAFQQYFRTHRPPLLAIWGKNDPFFLPSGAESYRRDIPDAEVHFLDTGHFALETHSAEIGAAMRDFLGGFGVR